MQKIFYEHIISLILSHFISNFFLNHNKIKKLILICKMINNLKKIKNNNYFKINNSYKKSYKHIIFLINQKIIATMNYQLSARFLSIGIQLCLTHTTVISKPLFK